MAFLPLKFVLSICDAIHLHETESKLDIGHTDVVLDILVCVLLEVLQGLNEFLEASLNKLGRMQTNKTQSRNGSTLLIESRKVKLDAKNVTTLRVGVKREALLGVFVFVNLLIVVLRLHGDQHLINDRVENACNLLFKHNCEITKVAESGLTQLVLRAILLSQTLHAELAEDLDKRLRHFRASACSNETTSAHERLAFDLLQLGGSLIVLGNDSVEAVRESLLVRKDFFARNVDQG